MPVDVYVASVDDATRLYAFRVLEQLRRAGVPCDGDFEGRSLSKQMRSANRMKAKFVAVVGPDEEKANSVTLKNMTDRSEQKVELLHVASKVMGR